MDPETKKERSTQRFGSEDSSPFRTLPSSFDAERGILCSILLSPAATFDHIAEQGLHLEDFHHPVHAQVFGILQAMHSAQIGIDPITLTEALSSEELLVKAGGPAGVTELFCYTPTAANAPQYIRIVRDKSKLRQVIILCNELSGRAYEPDIDASAFVDEAEGKLLALTEAHTPVTTSRHVSEGVTEALDQIENTYNHRGQVVGVPTGYHQLDRMTGGLRANQMITIGARPSMGKTALGVNICEYVAMTAGLPVQIFSLEMGYSELITRMLCGQAKLNLQRVRDGFMADKNFTDLGIAATKLSTAPIWIDDTPALSILDFRARARIAVKRRGVKLIMVDYLQLMKSTSKAARENRLAELTEISGGIKATAKELGIPIIVLAQLGRDADKRNPRTSRPKMSDLRECGAIEQDSDIVALIHRPEYYLKHDPEAMAEVEGQAELIIDKQRSGPVGTVELKFVKELARFENPEGQKRYSNNQEERQ